MTENSHRQTLTIELDQNMDEFDQKYISKKITVNMTKNIRRLRGFNFTIYQGVHITYFNLFL